MPRELNEYEKHVAHNHEDHKHKAWCGGWVSGQFVFTSIDHLAYERKRDGRLLPCPKCLDAIVATLTGQ